MPAMLDPNLARTRWGFLQTLHPLFLLAESLPTIEGADQGIYGSETVDVDHLKNEITTLRNDLKLNVIKQQLVDIDQLSEDEPTLEELDLDLQILLEELEDLIDPQVLILDEPRRAFDPECLSCFPRLVALRRLLENQESPAQEDHVQDEITSADDQDTSALTETNVTSTHTQSSWSRRYLPTSAAQVASFIRFPQDAAKIESCRRTISRFGMAMVRTLGDSTGSWAIETQAMDYTPQDVEAIQHAHDFASTCTSLFSQMVDSSKCGTLHQVKLQLSGFKKSQLKMHIRTCQETDWVSAVFTRSYEQPSLRAFYFDHICSHVSTPPEESKVLHVAFNSEGMWSSNNAAELDSLALLGREQSLADLLTHNHKVGLTLKYRKLAAVLLAASIFQLSDSPWIQQHLGPECIFVPSPDNRQLQQWCPRVLCTLVPEKNRHLQSDNIAAFGVLVLELEADRTADWTTDDEDWISGEKSNHVRLARILKSWEDLVGDDYRRVAKVCLEFDSLIESLDHPDIDTERRGLAVIYKCILEPLFRHVMKSFGNLAPVFKGMFGPDRSLTAPMNISPSATAKRVLFDDVDALPKRDDQLSASGFLGGLDPFFRRIKALHDNIISLTQQSSYEKIRIAVLDSGVDDTDSMIRPAIKFGRINIQKSRSFVGRPDEWAQDTFGHGTHVTQLLLKTAPAAEIYVGKICTGKVINDEFMPGIAKAIDWAVNECDAHIISMSFGFEDENELIDAALDNAIEAGKLVIAAASNNGGLSGRARPARQEGVICIHATDGKGNKGLMNPSPIPNRDNFSTLGVAVPFKWKGNDVWKSGTSFAVPIAVGFAADVLEFARCRCTNLKPRKLKLLHKKRGMEEIFRRMAEERDGYDFIHPVRLWKDWQDASTERQAARAIEDIMEEL